MVRVSWIAAVCVKNAGDGLDLDGSVKDFRYLQLKQPFDEVEKRFKEMGFDRSFPPGTPPEVDIEALKQDLHVEE